MSLCHHYIQHWHPPNHQRTTLGLIGLLRRQILDHRMKGMRFYSIFVLQKRQKIAYGCYQNFSIRSGPLDAAHLPNPRNAKLGQKTCPSSGAEWGGIPAPALVHTADLKTLLLSPWRQLPRYFVLDVGRTVQCRYLHTLQVFTRCSVDICRHYV